jgi:hypothetical protein
MWWRAVVPLILLVVAANCGIIGISHARAASKPLSVLVLGDSYSAGNGGGDYFGPKGCWRSRRNYAEDFGELVARAPHDLTVNVENRACSGATTSAFWSSFNKQPPQWDAVTKSDDIIFLTTGGDDIHFADIVKFCLVEPFLVGDHCLANLDRAEALVQSDALAQRLTRVLAGIRARTGRATKIVVVGYPYLIANPAFTLIDRGEGRQSDAGKACGERQQAVNVVTVGACLVRLGDSGDEIQQRLVSSLNAADHTNQFVFVPMKKLFAGPPDHALVAPISKTSGAQPNRWFIQPYWDASLVESDIWYHPNPTGWQREGALLANVLYGKSTPPPAAPACSATSLYSAWLVHARSIGFHGAPPSQYPPGEPAGAYDPKCDGGWAIAAISVPRVGETDGLNLFRASGDVWKWVDQQGGELSACQLEEAGVPSSVALRLSNGETGDCSQVQKHALEAEALRFRSCGSFTHNYPYNAGGPTALRVSVSAGRVNCALAQRVIEGSTGLRKE